MSHGQFSLGYDDPSQPEQQTLQSYSAHDAEQQQQQHADEQHQHQQQHREWPIDGLGLYTELANKAPNLAVSIRRQGSDASSTTLSSAVDFLSTATTSSSVSLPFSYNYDQAGTVSYDAGYVFTPRSSVDHGLGALILSESQPHPLFTDWNGFNGIQNSLQQQSDVNDVQLIGHISSDTDFNQGYPPLQESIPTYLLTMPVHDTDWSGTSSTVVEGSTPYTILQPSRKLPDQSKYGVDDHHIVDGGEGGLSLALNPPLKEREDEAKPKQMDAGLVRQDRRHSQTCRSNDKFVRQLWDMMANVENHKQVHWNDDGTTIVVPNVPEFAKGPLQSTFAHSNFSSFVRQLNMWGFQRVSGKSASLPWCFACENFQRARPELLSKMIRTTASKYSATSSYAAPQDVINPQPSSTTPNKTTNVETKVLKLGRQLSIEKDLSKRLRLNIHALEVQLKHEQAARRDADAKLAAFEGASRVQQTEQFEARRNLWTPTFSAFAIPEPSAWHQQPWTTSQLRNSEAQQRANIRLGWDDSHLGWDYQSPATQQDTAFTVPSLFPQLQPVIMEHPQLQMQLPPSIQYPQRIQDSFSIARMSSLPTMVVARDDTSCGSPDGDRVSKRRRTVQEASAVDDGLYGTTTARKQSF